MQTINYLLVILAVVTFSCGRKTVESTDAAMPVAPDSALQDTATLALAAHLYYEVENFQEAFNEYDKLVPMDSTNGKYVYRRAVCRLQLNWFLESVDDFKKAASLNYKPSNAYYNIALLYSTALSEDSLAILYAKKCLAIDPSHEKAKEILDWLTRPRPQIRA